jgi:hypothetical protein
MRYAEAAGRVCGLARAQGYNWGLRGLLEAVLGQDSVRGTH